MVVWLKPCKSRSSPGPLLKQYPGPFGPGYCLLCRHAMTWLAQDLQGKSRETLQPHCGARRSRDPQQVIARAFFQNPASADAGFFFARLATRNMASTGPCPPKPRTGCVRWASKYFSPQNKTPGMAGGFVWSRVRGSGRGVLQLLQRAHLELGRSRLGGEPGLFLGERVDALAL